MKRFHSIRFMAIAFIAILTSSAVIAQEKPEPGPVALSVTQPDTGKLKFTILIGNPSLQRVEVKVTNKDYGTIDRSVFRTLQYGMVCNLTDAEDGEYIIEVRAGKEVIKKSIGINTVRVFKTNRLVTFAPTKH